MNQINIKTIEKKQVSLKTNSKRTVYGEITVIMIKLNGSWRLMMNSK
jgi:hypothetical protein